MGGGTQWGGTKREGDRKRHRNWDAHCSVKEPVGEGHTPQYDLLEKATLGGTQRRLRGLRGWGGDKQAGMEDC